MIDFFSNGSLVGFSINGPIGFILLVYIMSEFCFLMSTQTFLFKKLYIYFMVHKQVRKIIPKWWSIQNISFITINKRSKNSYEVYIKLIRDIDKTSDYTNDWIQVDSMGRIVSQDFMNRIKHRDKDKNDEIKQFMRNKNLEDLGI